MAARSAVTVGRKTEVDLLLAALAAADLGEAKVAVVEGEAGIGKTWLVRNLVSRVPDGTIVAFGEVGDELYMFSKTVSVQCRASCRSSPSRTAPSWRRSRIGGVSCTP